MTRALFQWAVDNAHHSLIVKHTRQARSKKAKSLINYAWYAINNLYAPRRHELDKSAKEYNFWHRKHRIQILLISPKLSLETLQSPSSGWWFDNYLLPVPPKRGLFFSADFQAQTYHPQLLLAQAPLYRYHPYQVPEYLII